MTYVGLVGALGWMALGALTVQAAPAGLREEAKRGADKAFVDLLPSGLALLKQDEDIPDPCPPGYCSAAQEGIHGDFRRAGGLVKEWIPSLYSGPCYHRSPQYDGVRAHHGVVLVDARGEARYFAGQFSFFAEHNPYQAWTVEQARRELPAQYGDKWKLLLRRDHAFADLNPGKIPIMQYWLRQQPYSQEIVLLGYWGVSHVFLCSLERHRRDGP